MTSRTVRDFSKRGDAIPVPELTQVQASAYERFIQTDKAFDERDRNLGLESLMHEVFPIESYDGSMKLEYLYYKLDKPRYTPEECNELRLTYGMPFRIGVRLVREGISEIPEEEIYLGEIPIMLGGGEFIVNGAERVIVSQLHRSPGVDFNEADNLGDRPLHGARIIPERGSWIELEVTKKDVLAMKIDQSPKIAATIFLRALEEEFSSTEKILEMFYDVTEVKVVDLRPEHYSAELILNEEGEELCRVGEPIGDAIDAIQNSSMKMIRIVQDPSDPLILNTLAMERLDFMADATEHEAAAGAAAAQAPAALAQGRPLYRNADAPIAARVADLMARMTQAEKIAQIRTAWADKGKMIDDLAFNPAKASAAFPDGIGHVTRPSDKRGVPGISGAAGGTAARWRTPKQTVEFINALQRWAVEDTRLGIPVLLHEESLHGFAAKDATAFPQSIGLASTWDPDLVREINDLIAGEVRARGVGLRALELCGVRACELGHEAGHELGRGGRVGINDRLEFICVRVFIVQRRGQRGAARFNIIKRGFHEGQGRRTKVGRFVGVLHLVRRRHFFELFFRRLVVQ